jgi:acyl-CoA reductase-like NAD-dependent aldehyde dehydrogenase
VVNVVTGYGPSTGAALTRHPLVRKIAFTGGAATARHVVRSSAENFAKLSLELGGKSPNIIFADADLDSAINGAVAGIYAASGQSCVAGSRLLVQDEIYDEFVERLVERAKRIRIGNPQDDPAKWARWPPRSNWRWSKAWWPMPRPKARAAHGRQASGRPR